MRRGSNQHFLQNSFSEILDLCELGYTKTTVNLQKRVSRRQYLKSFAPFILSKGGRTDLKMFTKYVFLAQRGENQEVFKK